MSDWLTTNVIEAPDIRMNWAEAMQITHDLADLLKDIVLDDPEYISACEGDHLGKMGTYAGAGDHVYYYMKFPEAIHENIKMNFYASFVTEELMDWNLLSEVHRVSMKVEAQKFKQAYKDEMSDPYTMIDGILAEPMTDIGMEGWLGVILKRAIADNDIQELLPTKKLKDRAGNLRTRCVLAGETARLLYLLFNYSCAMMEMIEWALGGPGVRRTCRASVRRKLHEKMYEVLGEHSAPGYSQIKAKQAWEFMECQKLHSDGFRQQMFRTELPPAYWRKQEPSGVSPQNEHVIGMISTLETLRLCKVCMKKRPEELSDQHQATLMRYASEMFLWFNPESRAIKDLNVSEEHQKKWCEFFAAQLVDVDCTSKTAFTTKSSFLENDDAGKDESIYVVHVYAFM